MDMFDVFDNKETVTVLSAPVCTEQQAVAHNVLSDAITHHVAVVPTGMTYLELPVLDTFPMRDFGFALDDFQKIACSALTRNESVLVTAHTSSGKTLVAEYAVAIALANRQRLIYTSPIKALSNQKYRELEEQFGDVGLMTGDTTINPSASILVMTTEILRNMLYRGSEVLKEVRYVVYDEIHYLREKERGVVWEESIILLNSAVRLVFLSATVPNATEFAEWVAATKQQVVHVVGTERRVVPLQFFLSCRGTVAEVGRRGDGQKIDPAAIDRICALSGGRQVSRRGREAQDVQALVDAAPQPVIVFSFSRRECEKYAGANKKALLDDVEQEKVRTVFNSALSTLSEEDRGLSFIQQLLPMLLNGVAIHHSGLLPILREIIEILFQEGLVKILYATETFSIGLNMPAKSVVFTSISKYDGTARRLLSPGEFVQMSGRAGRRGLDPVGEVYVNVNERVTKMELTLLLSGKSDPIDSAFRLSYNMVLNLMRVEGYSPEQLLAMSFFHFQQLRRAKEGQARLRDYETMLLTLPKPSEHSKVTTMRKTCEQIVNECPSSEITRNMNVECVLPRGGSVLVVRGTVCSILADGTIYLKVQAADGTHTVRTERNYLNHPAFSNMPEFTVCEFCRGKLVGACILNECNMKFASPDAVYYRYYDKVAALRARVSTEIHHLDQCAKMTQVLRRLEYCDDFRVLTKGQVACEISCGEDELVLTEMIFNGDFMALEVEEIASVLSCIVCDEEQKSEVPVTYALIRDAVYKVAGFMQACGLLTSPDLLLKRFSPELMDVVKIWASGCSFTEMCASTDVFEGSIIRVFRRLEELLRQLGNAARVMGNNDLENMFGLATEKIKRGIIFSNSLYL